ncbi:GAF domain-containing SpoIIE family protein phosphatase [Nocardioides sp.]|uniref:PP2C family protein-serine/threonine phosphatase n=1 Tax=Nocardioides sp. TaxID=35761 RepID=UPI002C6F1307|nr:GAF domain-containing SpoIIE family protein phosphatase [Nocardioides sp.]HXH76990.1 GAF domain-containing SpoIIE family protein phosphatase [Nocardioides sp.]
MTRPDSIDLRALLSSAEDASPASAVETVAEHLREQVGAERVSFWIADAAGQALLLMPSGERLEIAGTSAGSAWLEQEVGRDESWWLPVTVRGDAIGVLEVRLDEAAESPEDLGEQLSAVAHLLAYIIVANQRHTDEYERARRSESFELSMEVQYQLLPEAFVCEGGSFRLAGWLEPSSTAGGDTFDYTVSRDRLTVSLIDAVGHDVGAAMLATLTISAMRKARRDGGDLRDQAAAAQAALIRHGDDEDYATGIIIEIDLDSRKQEDPATGGADADRATTDSGVIRARMLNAGHPLPRLVRDGKLSHVELTPDPPFGLDDQQVHGDYTAHGVELDPGDRLVLLTDGMYERSAESFDLDDHLVRTADLHPRNAVQKIAAAFREHVESAPEDDATFLLLDWCGGDTERDTEGGSDIQS